MILKVKVLEEDIKSARRANQHNLALQKALSRVLDTNFTVGADFFTILPQLDTRIKFPKQVWDYIRAFNRGVDPTSFEFEVEVEG